MKSKKQKLDFIKKFKNYLSNIFLIWFFILIYNTIEYYQNFLSPITQTTLFYLALAYTVLGFLFYLFTPLERISKSKGTIILGFFYKNLKSTFRLKKPSISKKEKTALLFVLVKAFFLPIMLNFVFGNYHHLNNLLNDLFELKPNLDIQTFNTMLFPLLLTGIFFIDTAIFALGYLFESSFLKNKIKSVEPTFLGWFVALACYPPFNGFITNYLDWFANDYAFFYNSQITFFIRIFIISLLIVYVSATIALGTKASNLTNRGIVTRFPYSIIRHPAYISKNLAWWITILPVISMPAILSMGTWSFIYHLRTITEERHLLQDPDYKDYCKKIKYRYIPGVY